MRSLWEDLKLECLGEQFVIRRHHPRSFVRELIKQQQEVKAKRYLIENYELRHEGLIGVEVGVWKGGNSYALCRELPIKKLYLVDPYAVYCEEDKTKDILNNAKRQAKKLLKNKPVVWIHKKSLEVTKKDIPEKLDFVYIDGEHTYNMVRKELRHYWRLLRTPGFIGGDDWIEPEVAKAVIEFAEQKKLEVNVVTNGGCFPEWYIIKE